MITSKGRAWLHGAVVALTIGTAVSIIAQQPVVFSSPQAVTQSGSWTQTVTQGTGSNLHVVVDTAPTTAVTGTFFQATQPVSATSLPLPTGAATESTLGNVLTQSDFDTKTGSLTEAAPASDTASSGLNGRLQRIAQRITSLITALGSPFQAGGSIGNSSFGTTNFPTTVDTNSGNKSASTIRVTLATDQLQLTNKLLVTPDANSAINNAQWNGQALASPDANSYVLSSGAATATTAAGTSTCYITSAASTNSTNCKASAGNLYEIHVTNTTTTNYFLRVYNSSSAPTCSSATGFVETVPALGAAANGGVNGRINTPPQAYTTGIGFCLTGGGSSTDNTNAATGVYVTLLYK